MNDALDKAIINLRAKVLTKKLALKNNHISKTEAARLVITYTDREAFIRAFEENSKPQSSWVKMNWTRILKVLQK